MSSFEPDVRTQALEDRLHDLISREPYATDDRRLARVYLALANLLRPQMNAEQAGCLDSLNSPGLKSATVLSDLACRMADRAPERTSQASEFIYQLLESCAKPAFTIWPDTDAEPIAWVLALGVSFDEVLAAVAREYPEIAPG